MLKRRYDKLSNGDTLVEVLFAMAIFSLVAVGSLSIMNKSTSTAQRALEISEVRQEINAQAETLRFLNASYIAAYPNYATGTPARQWANMLSTVNSTQSEIKITNTCPASVSELPSNSFILNTHTALYQKLTSSNYNLASTYSQVSYNGDNLVAANGIWIEAVASTTFTSNNQQNASYIDFYIHACWDSMGQTMPVTLDTVVRLYEPRG